jgi:rhodanese-related sulfurtransferase
LNVLDRARSRVRLCLFMTLFVIGCGKTENGGRTMAHAERFLTLVNDAKKRVKETNVPDVKRRMDAGEKFVLVDVREESEWAAGHLPGAIHIGRGIIERDIEQRVPDTSAKLVLYCGGGFRSALSADNLQKMGYTNVESMDGGWKGWIGAGLPTQKG